MLQEWLQKNLVPCGTKYFKNIFGYVIAKNMIL